jgi:hypothetical protein
MHSKHSLQGRRIQEYSFPSPACKVKTFKSRSTCLIDMGFVLIVLTEGSEDGAGPDHEKGLFRLEIDRNDVVLADETTPTRLSRDECKELLDSTLAAYEECQIHGVAFPFFGPDELTTVKTRPAICLYSNDADRPPIYLAMFAGTPRSAQSAAHQWEMTLTAGEDGDLCPAGAGDLLVDLSKVCVLPERYMLGQNDKLNGIETYSSWYLDGPNRHKILTVKSPEDLRRRIVQMLQAILLQNPHLKYKDTTRSLDVGSWVMKYDVLKGEDVERHMIYE